MPPDSDIQSRYLAYDIVSEMSFGEPMGFTKSGTDLFGLIQGFHAQQPIAGLMVRLHPFFNWLRTTGLAEKFLLPKPTDKTGYGRLMAVRLLSCLTTLHDAVQLRREVTGKRQDHG